MSAETGGVSEPQLRLYRAILVHWRDHGVSPTIKELCGELGYRSNNAVAEHLRALRAAGWLTPAGAKGSARGLCPAALDAIVRRKAADLLGAT